MLNLYSDEAIELYILDNMRRVSICIFDMQYDSINGLLSNTASFIQYSSYYAHLEVKHSVHGKPVEEAILIRPTQKYNHIPTFFFNSTSPTSLYVNHMVFTRQNRSAISIGQILYLAPTIFYK